jgi:hypothetical protein
MRKISVMQIAKMHICLTKGTSLNCQIGNVISILESNRDFSDISKIYMMLGQGLQ